MGERVGFIAAGERNELTFSEICERFEISRETGYKWRGRYESSGRAGLVDLSRRPYHSPNATARRVSDGLEELRRRHPTWGAGKLLRILQRRQPGWELPTRSTACELLKRAGLVRQRRRHSRVGRPGPPLSENERAERGVVSGLQGSVQDAGRGELSRPVFTRLTAVGVVDSSRDRA